MDRKEEAMSLLFSIECFNFVYSFLSAPVSLRCHLPSRSSLKERSVSVFIDVFAVTVTAFTVKNTVSIEEEKS
jgi:hypothetical protein